MMDQDKVKDFLRREWAHLAPVVHPKAHRACTDPPWVLVQVLIILCKDIRIKVHRLLVISRDLGMVHDLMGQEVRMVPDNKECPDPANVHRPEWSTNSSFMEVHRDL